MSLRSDAPHLAIDAPEAGQTRPTSPTGRPPVRARVVRVARGWWRWLTSMPTALMLLFLLALAAVPGSLLPQRPLSQSAVAQYFADNPQLAPILDRLGLFDVFAAPWFAAIYLLLFVSLIGCLVPRTLGHIRSLRAAPPRAPSRLSRLPRHAELSTDLGAEEALDVAEEELRVARYRVLRKDGAISAEKGLLKETGNLVFHLALLAMLISLAVGKLWGYEGSVLVQEGQGFCNSFQQYDTYSAGPLIDGADLSPLCVDLEDFQARYEPDLTPASFTGDITYSRALDGPDEQATIGINSPLRVDGTRLYLTGRGFAPIFSVRLPDGTELTDLSAPFLPTDSTTMLSEGVLKLPDLGAGRDQLAVEGVFLPTAADMGGGLLTSVDPRPLDPAVAIVVYTGSVGLDSGIPQNVFTLDQERIGRGQLERVGAANLRPGESLNLPDGTSITFTGFKEFAALQLSRDPSQLAVLISALAMLAGLLTTLLVRRRRVFLRPGDKVLEIGGLAQGGSAEPAEFERVVTGISTALAAAGPPDRRDH
ncbi:MAG: cytochrome c biogenesis protein ResB [Geodermatophilaceae bacterium]|nr:cytochrome c biogenesis protein ResB [Geodermatophilaceae bacterium]